MDFLESLEKEFTFLPQEMQQKFSAHRKSNERLKQAEQQAQLWNQELKQARILNEVTMNDWVNVLNRYNPDTKTLEPALKIIHSEHTTEQ